jgi:hypothetical protein
MALAAFRRLARSAAPQPGLAELVSALPPINELREKPSLLVPCLAELVPAALQPTDRTSWSVADVVVVATSLNQVNGDNLAGANEAAAIALGELVRADSADQNEDVMSLIADALAVFAKDDCALLFEAVRAIEALRSTFASLWDTPTTATEHEQEAPTATTPLGFANDVFLASKAANVPVLGTNTSSSRSHAY